MRGGRKKKFKGGEIADVGHKTSVSSSAHTCDRALSDHTHMGTGNLPFTAKCLSGFMNELAGGLLPLIRQHSR